MKKLYKIRFQDSEGNIHTTFTKAIDLEEAIDELKGYLKKNGYSQTETQIVSVKWKPSKK